MKIPSCLPQALFVTLIFSGCTHQPLGPKIDNRSGINTQELVKRFGYPNCHVTVPLTAEQAVASAELVGAPHIDQRKDWVELTNKMISGDELRHVWCNPHRGRGGVDLIGLFRDGNIIADLHTVFVD